MTTTILNRRAAVPRETMETKIPRASRHAALCVRQLGPSDLSAIERHLLELEPADRRARFLYCAGDAAIAAYARWLDPSKAVLIGAFDPFCESDRLIGLAEAHLGEAPRMVEIGVTVDAYFRRRGMGRRLVAVVLAFAFAGGARAAQFFFAPSSNARGMAQAGV